MEADLLLHVIDAASPDVQGQRATVLRVLRELGVTDAQLRCKVVEVSARLCQGLGCDPLHGGGGERPHDARV